MGQVIQMRRNTITRAHPAYVAYQPYAGLGALGLAPGGETVVKTAGVTAAGAGASSIAIGAGYGAVAGPIGIVVGAIVGLALGALLNKNYLNVAQANAGEDQAVQAFNQYRTIAGTVAGRQIGVPAMTAIFDGAVYSGVFPLNNQQKSFHEGALKYPGNPDWVWGVMNNGANNPYTFAWALQQYRNARSSQGANLPDAIPFIDNFFIPSNQHDSPAWAVPTNATAHQLLYDAADAYLATYAGFTTTPFVASEWNANQVAAAQGSAQVLPAASSTTLPALVPVTGATMMRTQPYDSVGVSLVAAPANPGVPLLATATPVFAAQNPAIAAASGAVTTTAAATLANLNAALAAQGYTFVGMSSGGSGGAGGAGGFPLYSQAGMVYAYQNGTLFPYGSVAQLASTGNAGQGISTPATGLDPNTLAAIQAAVAQGIAPLAAAQGAAQNLIAQGVPVTPDVQGQLASAANAVAVQPAGIFSSSGGTLLVVGGIVLAVLLLRKSR